ncbi:MAG TPA: DUF4394 domain-containing protein, partial [Pyrinomonadaceae bacterium]
MKKIFDGRSVFTMLFLLGLLFAVGSVNAQTVTAPVYGVTAANQLIRFNTATPNNITTIGPVIGLQGGENIVGIDFRPANGQLYALSSLGRLFTVNLVTGVATQVGTTGA